MTSLTHRITGGVDTHLDVHVAAALDELGALLGTESFPATAAGYRRLLAWLRGFGVVELVGVEGTGSYGAGLTRHLHAEGIRVVEADRLNRQNRRRRGKSDTVDAVSAARAAQSGDASGTAKTRNGNVEMMRVLRLVKLSARRGRTVALNQMRSMADNLKRWEDAAPTASPALVLIAAGNAHANSAFGLRSPVLADPTSTVAARYGVAGTPIGILVDADGRIASAPAPGSDAVLAALGALPA